MPIRLNAIFDRGLVLADIKPLVPLTEEYDFVCISLNNIGRVTAALPECPAFEMHRPVAGIANNSILI